MGGKLMTPKDQVLEVWGDLACFTRPELKVERFSYPIITPSAARGIYDAIYCKPNRYGKEAEFRWQITAIEVLPWDDRERLRTPYSPSYIALRRNEVKEKGPSGVRAPFQDAEPQARDLKEMLGSRRGVDRRRVPFARQDFRDRDVGSGEIVRLQAGRPHPEDLLVVTEQEIARAVGYPVSPEVNFRMGIGVTATSHEGTHGDIDPELLLHLPSQASLGGLAGFYFSSGELPLALHAVSPPAASDQNPAVLFQNGGRNGYLLQGGSFGAHSA